MGKNPLDILGRSRALWNRDRLDPESDETLAQILDRGTLADWQALFALLKREGNDGKALRERVHRLLYKVPLAHPYFWLSVLAGLGREVDWSSPPRESSGGAEI